MENNWEARFPVPVKATFAELYSVAEAAPIQRRTVEVLDTVADIAICTCTVVLATTA